MLKSIPKKIQNFPIISKAPFTSSILMLLNTCIVLKGCTDNHLFSNFWDCGNLVSTSLFRCKNECINYLLRNLILPLFANVSFIYLINQSFRTLVQSWKVVLIIAASPTFCLRLMTNNHDDMLVLSSHHLLVCGCHPDRVYCKVSPSHHHQIIAVWPLQCRTA